MLTVKVALCSLRSLERAVPWRVTSSHRCWGHESSECGWEGKREPEAQKEMGTPHPHPGLGARGRRVEATFGDLRG